MQEMLRPERSERPKVAIKITDIQTRFLSGWGTHFLNRARALVPGFGDFVSKLADESLLITCWDDCAGGDMPHWVFRELALPTVVIALCERAAGPRKWLQANVRTRCFSTIFLRETIHFLRLAHEGGLFGIQRDFPARRFRP